MLFTTAAFSFLFLPLVVLGFFLLSRAGHRWGAAWLFAASLFFYGYWMPQFTLLLLASIVGNFFIGKNISQALAQAHSQADSATSDADVYRKRAKTIMIVGVVFNLALLVYFKYANFFLETARQALGPSIPLLDVTLPIGISFYTFTQIAFLADAYQKGVSEYKFTHYGLFVTYFPHLIAGPVLHHKQMMPQFGNAQTYRFQFDNIAAGLAIFAIGLFKKIILADGISPYADTIFNAPVDGALGSAEAWLGAIAYTFQLYFDFSGYSDMAVGLSWMLNVKLPFNFDSPYKSLSISEFWRRWHITLSTFLRDYLYIPMGGNRHGPIRRYINLALTMLLGGLWHGANWTFVFWGGLHGLYLGINHAFRAATEKFQPTLDRSRLFTVASWALTFLAVEIAWIFFRATSFAGALHVLANMFSTELFSAVANTSPQSNPQLWNAGLHVPTGALLCGILGVVAVAMPNSNWIGERIHEQCKRSHVRSSLAFGFSAVTMAFLVVVNEARDTVSAFIYFNF